MFITIGNLERRSSIDGGGPGVSCLSVEEKIKHEADKIKWKRIIEQADKRIERLKSERHHSGLKYEYVKAPKDRNTI